MNYYVMARLDSPKEVTGKPAQGNYALATSRSFPSFDEANHYADGIAPSRKPKILLEVLALPDNGAAG